MSRSQKRKYFESVRAKDREDKLKADKIMRAAQQEEGKKIIQEYDTEGDEELEVIGDDPSHNIPFDIHHTHRIVFCGGYVACTKCAAMGSTSTRRNQLGKLCPGQAARNDFSVRRLHRLLRAEHPRPDRSHSWPNGERHPTPRMVQKTSPPAPAAGV